MPSKIIYGHKIANNIIHKLKNKVKNLKLLGKRIPGLAVIVIGKNISSTIYINKKKIICKKIGFIFQKWKFKKTVNENKIIEIIHQLNKNNTIDGILIQLPLPKNFNTHKILESIHPKKDVDGFHPYNIGCLCQKSPKLRPCTPKGIITLLKTHKINIKGLNATIIGASNIVGRPMGLELLLSGCTTTITHRFTKNLKYHIQNADLIIVAVGKPLFLKNKNLKKNVIIIDVGINQFNNNQIVGDVDFNSIYPYVSYITPVPKGVGPMTIASLMENTLYAYQNKYKYKNSYKSLMY